MARTLLQDVDRVIASAWYRAWALVHKTDAQKIALERQGKRRPLSQDSWARCFIESIRLAISVDPTPPPPPPPPPPFKRVAPKVANKQDGSDARFCVTNQPGVVPDPDHPEGPGMKDDVARYDMNGLHRGGRSDDCTQWQTPGLVGARELDGREPCELPRVGQPENNTGSWQL